MKKTDLFFTVLMIAGVLFVLSNSIWAAEQAQVTKAPIQREAIQKQTVMTIPLNVISCSCSQSISGLPKPLGDGKWSFAETIKVTNKSSNAINFTASGSVTVVVNGATKVKNCTAVAGQQSNPNTTVTVNLQCGSEQSDTTAPGIQSGSGMIKKADGSVIKCRQDTTPIPTPR